MMRVIVIKTPARGFLETADKRGLTRIASAKISEKICVNPRNKMFSRIANFLKEVRQELKKVTWPTRRDTVKYTVIVVVISLAVAVFLGAADFVFTWLMNKFVI